MAKWIRLAVMILLAVAIVVAIAWSFVPKPVGVDTAEVTAGAFEATVDVDGVTRVQESYVVSAPFAASLHRLDLHAGGTVDIGAVVARLSPIDPPLLDARSAAGARATLAAARAGLAQARAAIERARLGHDYASRELARLRDLSARGAITAHAVDQAELEAQTRARELDATRFAARVAAHEVELAEATLARSQTRAGREQTVELRSPVAGRVLRVLREDEGVVAAGTPLLEIADLSRLEVVADVATSDAVSIQPGAPVRLAAWGGGEVLRGHVRLVEPAAFTKLSALGIEEQRVNVVIELDEPAERRGALGDGYRVEAAIVVWQAPDVVQIPASALFRTAGAWSVFLWRDGRARLHPVEPGRHSGVRAQIVGGLTGGETVIVHPGDAVADGVRVSRRAR
jgi:HlyD family secretion protein